MPILTITSAANLYGKSRSTLYKHNKSGLLSFSQSDDGQPGVDLSELIRVYGPVPSKHDDKCIEIHTDTNEVQALTETVKVHERLLTDAKEREDWLRERLENSERLLFAAQEQIRQLTDQRQSQKTSKKRWWPW